MLTAVSLVMFFAAGQQSEMAPQEYLKRNLGLSWLLPLLYVLLALTLMWWAGMRYSSRSRQTLDQLTGADRTCAVHLHRRHCAHRVGQRVLLPEGDQ